MANSKNHWISQRNDGNWADKREGTTRASKLHDTQQDAFDAARKQALREGGEVIIKNRDGIIRERNTYGKSDPFPPRG